MNNIWKKNKINKILYVLNTDTVKLGKGKRKVFTIKNPNLNELWFYYINKKDIGMLQLMLDDNAVSINMGDSLDGDTLVHRAIQQNSMKLLDFSLLNKIDLYKKSNVEEETAFYESSYGYVSLNMFKKIWSNMLGTKIISQFNEKNCEEIDLIEKLCSDDRNIKKLSWIKEKFKSEWDEFISDKDTANKLIEHSKRCGAFKITMLLNGLTEVRDNLINDLKVNNTSKNKGSLKI